TRCYRDWSSDVCSSDLVIVIPDHHPQRLPGSLEQAGLSCDIAESAIAVVVVERRWLSPIVGRPADALPAGGIGADLIGLRDPLRPEERRVGKECWERGT